MSTEAETTSATGTVATPAKVAPAKESPAKESPAKEAPAKEGDSAPTTPSKETDEARTQLTQGRRHLLVKDYFSAVAALAKGCELLAQKFGDTAPELGDAYLTYGRALLELARSESGVLGMNEEGETAAEGEDDEEDEEGEEGEDEGEDGEENDAEAKENGEAAATDAKEDAKENGEAAAKANGEATDVKENGKDAVKENGKDAETKANGTEAKENGAEAKNGTDSEATNGKEAADPDQTLKEEEEDDDVNNLQLSWEVLELAKGIFQKQIENEEESKQTCLKLAEVHLKLGEVGVESENYITAVEDIKACLQLQKKYLDEDDRRIAETLYNMGVAYSLANEFDSAIEQFQSASAQIEKRIENLEKKKSEPAAEEKSATDDPFYTVQGEIDELKALLPEMKDKITDMQDFKKETVRRMMDGLAEASAKQSSTADGAGPSTASDKPVSSVAHLVKRKPKEEVKEEAPAADKTEKTDTSPAVKTETEKMDTSPVKNTEEKTEKVESSSAKSTEEKTEKESKPAESTEEKKADEEVSDRKRKPEDPVEVEDPTKKAKVEESTESKQSE